MIRYTIHCPVVKLSKYWDDIPILSSFIHLTSKTKRIGKSKKTE
jgi:hypothetical protein